MEIVGQWQVYTNFVHLSSYIKTIGLNKKENICVCRSLEQEQSLRRKAELESAQYKLTLQVVTNKYGQAQQELQVSVTSVSFPIS